MPNTQHTGAHRAAGSGPSKVREHPKPKQRAKSVSADLALVVAQHQRRLDHVSKRGYLHMSPNINLSDEKTRSAAAELGVNDPTIRITIAIAHVGNSLPQFAQKLSTFLVNASTSSWS